MPLIIAWFRAFCLTVLVEALVAPLLLGPRWSRQRRVAAAAVGQIATHPAVWFIFPELLSSSRAAFLVVGESWAVLLETGVYLLTLPGITARLAFRTSFAANALSFGLGVLLHLRWPWF